MPRPTALSSLLGLGVALVVAGCGGSSSGTKATPATTDASPPTSTQPSLNSTGSAPPTTPSTATVTTSSGPALTKAAYIGQADVICKQAEVEFIAQQKQIDAAGKADQAHDTLPNRIAVADALRADLTLAQQQLARLRALTPPASDRQTVTAYLTAVGNQLAFVSRLASGIQANDATGVKALNTELASGAQQTRILASSYGFKVCGAGTG